MNIAPANARLDAQGILEEAGRSLHLFSNDKIVFACNKCNANTWDTECDNNFYYLTYHFCKNKIELKGGTPKNETTN